MMKLGETNQNKTEFDRSHVPQCLWRDTAVFITFIRLWSECCSTEVSSSFNMQTSAEQTDPGPVLWKQPKGSCPASVCLSLSPLGSGPVQQRPDRPVSAGRGSRPHTLTLWAGWSDTRGAVGTDWVHLQDTCPHFHTVTHLVQSVSCGMSATSCSEKHFFMFSEVLPMMSPSTPSWRVTMTTAFPRCSSMACKEP